MVGQSEPESPCIRECTLDPETDVCVGCFRTLDEITRWSTCSADAKRAILEAARRRAGEYARRRASPRPTHDPD